MDVRGRDVGREEVSEIWGSQLVKGSVGEEQDVEVDSAGNRKSVEVLWGQGGDVVPGFGGSCILDRLEFIDEAGTDAIEE